jgi:uncharacterized protein YdhG (YjbR/CyaY superfamily)
VTSKNTDLPKIEAYFQAVPPESWDTLQQIRATIKELEPEADEAISYGMPAFKLGGRSLAGYAAYKTHCSYFPMSGAVTEQLAGELQDYETSKGGFKFPIGQPPSKALIKRLLSARKAELESK